MNLTELKAHVAKLITDYPDLEEEMNDSLQLCINEIDEGESVNNEINHCLYHLEEIMEDYNN